MEELFVVRPLATLWLAFFSFVLQATTIVPFANLGTLTDRSDALVMARVIRNYEHSEDSRTFFRSRLVVEESIKGSLLVGDQFDVQKWEKLIDETWITMWGDLNLNPESRYLLFLEYRGEGLYHPLCFSYYVFEEISREGLTYIVPSPESKEFELVDLHQAEPLYVYEKTALIRHLKDFTEGIVSWNVAEARTDLTLDDFVHYSKRSAPAGCTYLTAGSKNLRWRYFPDQSVGIHYQNTGAGGCASTISQAQQAIAALSNAYPGINVIDGGSLGSVSNCGDGTALGSDYRSYIDNNLGSYRHAIIQFDDPCNEISNLTNCSGILALGGAYGIGSHTYENVSWATAQYGYVVVNNGVGACRCNNLQEILSHELSHALGLGHISASFGTANMNPSCCSPISSLDETCFDYVYPLTTSDNLLPVELVSFQGNAGQALNYLEWKTASESNVNKFVVERADNGDFVFSAIAEISSKGDTETGHQYEWKDKDPDPENYYRLKTVDFDGTSELSNVISIKREEDEAVKVYPTIAQDFTNIHIPASTPVKIQIFSVTGQLIRQQDLNGKYFQIPIGDLQPGWYFLKVFTARSNQTFEFFRN